MPATSLLQDELILALRNLEDTSTRIARNRIEKTIKKLDKAIIPENDFDKVVDFIFLLVQEIPSITSNPNDKRLKELCLYCMDPLQPHYFLGSKGG